MVFFSLQSYQFISIFPHLIKLIIFYAILPLLDLSYLYNHHLLHFLLITAYLFFQKLFLFGWICLQIQILLFIILITLFVLNLLLHFLQQNFHLSFFHFNLIDLYLQKIFFYLLLYKIFGFLLA